SRGGRFRDRDREMDAVRWFSLDEAERAAAFASERQLVRRARALLAARSTRDLVSGRARTARVAPGGQGRRRAAAGEAGAADFPERERVVGDDVYTARRTQSPRALSLPRRLRRPRHGVRTIHRTAHARFRFRPDTRSR